LFGHLAAVEQTRMGLVRTVTVSCYMSGAARVSVA